MFERLHKRRQQGHLQEAVQADGQQWGEACDQTVRVQHVCSGVQERRKTRVHRHERRHLCAAGNNVSQGIPPFHTCPAGADVMRSGKVGNKKIIWTYCVNMLIVKVPYECHGWGSATAMLERCWQFKRMVGRHVIMQSFARPLCRHIATQGNGNTDSP